MTEPTWQRVCLLCIQRDRTTRLESGHCCAACAGWLATQIADIARLAADAAAWVAPGSSTGGSGRPVPGSRPPVNVSALDPELTPIGPPPSATVLEVLEAWERMIRDMRGMAPYGAATEARTRGGLYEGTSATLVASVAFLGRQVPWITTTEDFPLDDLADEIRACVRVLRRWDHEAEDRGQMVPCPTVTEEGECGYRLAYRSADEVVTCRRCGATRDVAQLVYVAMSDGRPVWMDPEAAASWLGISEGTLRQWARQGKVERSHGRYRMTMEATA